MCVRWDSSFATQRTFDWLKRHPLTEEPEMIDRCGAVRTTLLSPSGCSWAHTYGKSVRRASVMPSPARRMGVKPIRRLMTEPVKGPTGVCWKVKAVSCAQWNTAAYAFLLLH